MRLDRPRVVFLPLHWVIVHPIDEASPLLGVTAETFPSLEPEILVLVSGTDDTFSQVVHARSSYRAGEVAWGARFADMFLRTGEGLVGVDMRSSTTSSRPRTSPLVPPARRRPELVAREEVAVEADRSTRGRRRGGRLTASTRSLSACRRPRRRATRAARARPHLRLERAGLGFRSAPRRPGPRARRETPREGRGHAAASAPSVHITPPGFRRRAAASKNSTEYRLPLPGVSGQRGVVSMRS